MASRMETTDVGKGRSLDEEDDDRREYVDILEGVRDRASRHIGVRESCFRGIATGKVSVDPGCSTVLRRRKPRRFEVA